MRTYTKIFAPLALACISTTAMAQAVPFTDYTVSDTVSSVTTIKVDANMMDTYLGNLRETWVASNEVRLSLGQIESYGIYVSDLQNSGDFNLLLVVRFANTADLAPNKAKYDAFMQAWGDANMKKSEEISATVYPNIREITGEYHFREIKMAPK